jgi:hypothetical protein
MIYLAVTACYYLGIEIDIFILPEEAGNLVSLGLVVSTHLEGAANLVSPGYVVSTHLEESANLGSPGYGISTHL